MHQTCHAAYRMSGLRERDGERAPGSARVQGAAFARTCSVANDFLRRAPSGGRTRFGLGTPFSSAACT